MKNYALLYDDSVGHYRVIYASVADPGRWIVDTARSPFAAEGPAMEYVAALNEETGRIRREVGWTQ